MGDRRLRVHDSGDEIARLHEKLKNVGVGVPSEEIRCRFVGPATRDPIVK